ncbi:MAG: hypothetical protein ACE5K3_01630 [bacterium]
MFLESLRKRNQRLIRVAAKLHREKRISPNTYVLDLDAIRQNIRKIKEQANKFNLKVYPMTKQIGRNPFVLKIIKEEDLGPPVAVDWMGAKQLSKQGIRIGHIGRLVQVPHTEVESILKLRPEVWTEELENTLGIPITQINAPGTTSIFVTRANIAVVSGIQRKGPKIEGIFCQTWLQNGILKNRSEFEGSDRGV